MDEDPVIAEYDVYLTPALQEQILLLQYPNRPRNRPYNSQYGATPHDMRIKPKSGFVEVDVKLNSNHNFNKYMGLKWGDASNASKQLHNASGTFGPAAGLSGAKPRNARRDGPLKDTAQRDVDLENDLQSFREAEQEHRVHAAQTLGGQIIRHDDELDAGKPHYFVGAFQGDQLHLTKIDGTVQMRPNFHHLDAEEERARISASRAQADAAGPKPAQTPQSVLRQLKEQKEQANREPTLEEKLKAILTAAEAEKWIRMEYIDDEDPQAYEEFNEKLKIGDVEKVPHLKSQMDNDAFLDAISLPRDGSPTRRRKRAPRRKQNQEQIDISDDDADDEMAGVQAG
ncbi:Putative DNA-directed RNA polymerase III subunit Rpc5 [Septoria linicola]|uniref:DNA-directed RNA polymerase III subunit Rpc5 n=1 Tax=Septoria linicola TaxID=215465 RepID=A0A9Q9ENL5_9PEZI|nr:Putative DNA-directed RNA polymerase III subunit Rpc5 [Septoria linicola]